MLAHLNERMYSRSPRTACSAFRKLASRPPNSSPYSKCVRNGSFRAMVPVSAAATPPAGENSEDLSRGCGDDDSEHRDDALLQPKPNSSKPVDGQARQSDMQPKPAPGGSKPTIEETPLREANRGVMLGVLTLRAARTLVVYLQETNLNLCQWLVAYMNRNPINLQGGWEDVSGNNFLRSLLSMPIQEARWDNGGDPLHNLGSSCDVDPRNIAQRILAIRAQLAMELAEDMRMVSEDNEDLLQRCFRSSLANCMRISTIDRPPLASMRADGRGDK